MLVGRSGKATGSIRSRWLCRRTAQTGPDFLRDHSLVPELFPQGTFSAGTIAAFPQAVAVVAGGEKVEFYSCSPWQCSLSPEDEICAGERSKLLKVFPTNCRDFDSAGIKLTSVAPFSEQPHSSGTDRK